MARQAARRRRVAPMALERAAPVARAFVALGANLGNALATLETALGELSRLPGCELRDRSSWYRTAPIDAPGGDYTNGVVAIDTTLTPEALLAELQAIERRHGRQRGTRNAPRTLDLDLLAHGSAVRATAALTLPHPRLHERAFALVPLLELEPALVLPGLGALGDWLPAVAGQRIEKLGGIASARPTIPR